MNGAVLKHDPAQLALPSPTPAPAAYQPESSVAENGYSARIGSHMPAESVGIFDRQEVALFRFVAVAQWLSTRKAAGDAAWPRRLFR
jgi:hypothetical protein